MKDEFTIKLLLDSQIKQNQHSDRLIVYWLNNINTLLEAAGIV